MPEPAPSLLTIVLTIGVGPRGAARVALAPTPARKRRDRHMCAAPVATSPRHDGTSTRRPLIPLVSEPIFDAEAPRTPVRAQSLTPADNAAATATWRGAGAVWLALTARSR